MIFRPIRRFALLISALCYAVLSAISLQAQTAPAGHELLPADSTSAFHLSGEIDGVTSKIVPVKQPEFDSALEVNVPVARKQAWDTQLVAEGLPAIKKGDVIYLTFWLRAIRSANETGEVLVGMVLEEPVTFKKVLDENFSAGAEWRQYQYPVQADSNIAAAKLNVRIGGLSQRLQIANIHLTNHGSEVTVEQLPKTKFSYGGREPDAAWRKAALERIDRIRKGDLTVQVRDRKGELVPDAKVVVAMQRHAFAWGTEIGDGIFFEKTPAGDAYRQLLQANFNYAVPGVLLKWPEWERQRDRALLTIKTLGEMGFPMKAHNLIWPSWQGLIHGQGWAYLPKRIYELRDQPDKLREACEAHITDQAATLNGLVDAFDVINEPWQNHDIMDVLGEKEMAHWFELTRASAPKARLVLNEAITLDWGPGADNLLRIVGDLQKAGAPIQALGLQCHYGVSLTAPEVLLRSLDRYAQSGLSLEITEFDLIGTDRQLQADYLRDFIIAIFSHPKITHFIQWGFTDAMHWRSQDQAGLWDREMKPKEAALAYRELVYHQFWTNTTGSTDKSGMYQTRAFAGNYKITVTQADRTEEVNLDVPATGITTVVTLK